jgi:UDP-N-acetylglucosamine:LPS N-acetylglucosamine transferase
MSASRTEETILILTTHTGGGHLNLAQSLKDLLSTDYNVVIMNPQSPISERWYTFVSRHWTNFLTLQFAITDNEIVSFILQCVLTPLSFRRILSIIAHIQPRLVFTTHAFLAYATARALSCRGDPRGRPPSRIPLVFQLTDLERVHTTWFCEKHADAYLAPTREIFAQALEFGIDAKRLYVTGRPIRRQFIEASPHMRNEILNALGFDPTVFTIFLQGGAKGSARVDRTIESLLGTNIQIILAAGNNKDLAARYAGMKQVRVLPFTEIIAPYMAAADIIAGKAGASFISEAFMLEKPFLVTAFIPGQETPNLEFIKRYNLGWVCLDKTAQQALLTEIAHNPALLEEKVNSIRAYKAWNSKANQAIRPLIEHLLA